MTKPRAYLKNLTDEAKHVSFVFDSNPSHILYELLTDTDFGMGAPTTSINLASFEDAADDLFAENFGLSMLWVEPLTIEAFANEILDHIEATLFVSPLDGLLQLKLIRNDFDVDALRVFTPDNSNVTKFARKLWGETVNEISVTYTDPTTEEEKTVVAQDLGNIAMQGGIVADQRNYYGVHNKLLAMTLAQRDLRAASTPLASCEIEVDRSAWDLLPGEVVKLNSPEDQVVNLIMRVGRVDYGKPGDPTVRASLVEDVFSLSLSEFTEPPDAIDTDPSEDPSPADFELIFTLPFFWAVNLVASDQLEGAAYPEVIAGILAGEDGGDTAEFELLGDAVDAAGNPVTEILATLIIAGHGTLPAAFPLELTTTVAAFDDETANGAGPTVGGFVLIEGVAPSGGSAETTSEICLISAFGGGLFSLERGVLDTVPRAWPAGTACWFLDTSIVLHDPITRSDAETVDYKVLPRSSRGLLPESEATEISETLTGRPWLPTRPANVKVDGSAFGVVEAAGVDPIPVTWSRRNRETEGALVLNWDDGDVTPESGQVTIIFLTDLAGAVLHTYADNSGTSQNVDPADFGSETEGFIVVKSSFGGSGALESLQEFATEVRLLVQGSGICTIDGGMSGDATIV